MAGIGFELKKLFHKKSALGYLQACSYTAVVTVGPFVLMTSMILMIQFMLWVSDATYNVEQLFLASVIYPLVFSQILSSGFAMIITRFVSDKLYAKEYNGILSSLYGMLVVALLFTSIPAVWFLWKSPLDISMKLVTYILYMQLNIIWIQGVYLTALKDYMKIIKSYVMGVIVAIILSFVVIKTSYLDVNLGLMLAVDTGIFVMMTMLMSNIVKFFPESDNKYFAFLSSFEKHISLFFINLFYYLSLYCPVFIIWNGPLSIRVADTYVLAPVYDVATFYAFLSIIPMMIVFVIITELNFYDKYTSYFKLITGKGNYREIEDAKRDMLHVMWSEIRNLMEVQLVATIIFLVLGNYLLPKIGLAYESINFYNLLAICAYLSGMTQVIFIIMLYFEDRRGALWIATLFLATSAGFNYVSVLMGENTYGFGLFLASFISLATAMVRLVYYTNRIDYFVFCSQPVFNRGQNGLLSKLVARLYN
jgi:uncharacterized membrane protein